MEVIPGWNQYVAPLRDKSIFWHEVWVDCGRPRDGIVANIMRRNTASYHFAVRFVKNNRLDIIKSRFATSILANNNRDFWYEAKKICGGKCEPHRTVDGLSQPDDIANLFARSYADLYTSVGFCEAEMADLKDEISDMVSKDEFNEHCIVTVKDVIEAVSRLKFGIHDGHSSLTTDHVKHACNEMLVHISMLLSALIVHGSITDDLSVTTILPTPKGKNLNYSCSANYRGIALSSIIGKILDAHILNRYDRLLVSTDMQFGFKVAHSTSMCSMILKETIEHYRRNNSTVYCVMLDATKAFDRVSYVKLVRLLFEKKLPVVIIRIL
jgi:hypothetical protein